MLEFSCVAPIKSVHSLLEAHSALDMLRDPLITIATQEINSEKRSRREIQKDIKAKERAIEAISSKYAYVSSSSGPGLSQEQLRQALYSIGDNHAANPISQYHSSPSKPNTHRFRDGSPGLVATFLIDRN